MVALIPIKCARTKMRRNVEISSHSLKSQIHFRKPRQPWKVDARIYGWTVRNERRVLIDHHGVNIDLRPIPQSRYAVSEIELRKPLSGISANTHLMRIEGPQEVSPGKWVTGTAELSRES